MCYNRLYNWKGPIMLNTYQIRFNYIQEQLKHSRHAYNLRRELDRLYIEMESKGIPIPYKKTLIR